MTGRPEHHGGTTTPPPSRPPVVEGATREIAKATLVPLVVEDQPTGHALIKAGYARQLELQPGDVDAVRKDETAEVSEAVLDVLAAYEGNPADLAPLPVADLGAFGRALVRLREGSPELRSAAAAAVHGFEANTRETPLGMLNLERLEMTPAGIERGELVATVPLAPLEETAVVEKEWSVQSREFSSIVTDSLEEFSETGVTDNTELAQSTSSQQQHSNQFNITGTVSGGIPVISGSASSGFTAQNSSSESATDSRKHAKNLTQKASTRSKQEHKVTITTKSVVGREETTTRKLRNPSDTDPIRIDYFSLLRKWRVRLYRYGLRLTYDIVIPEPGSALRKAYRELDLLRQELKPFEFLLRHEEITPENYLRYGEQYGASGLPQPPVAGLEHEMYPVEGGGGEGRSAARMPVKIRDGYEIVEVVLSGHMTTFKDKLGQFTILGTTVNFEEKFGNKTFPPNFVLKAEVGGGNFLAGATGSPVLVLVFDNVATQALQLTVKVKLAGEALSKWRSEVWNALFNAAQTKHYAKQQDVAAKIAALEDKLNHVDTLTLRREESDEIMKAVLRFMLGTQYRFMSGKASEAFDAAGVDRKYGVGFDGNDLPITDSAQYAALQKHERDVRFVNQAIEWENVVSFLYSYFWDVPESWDFVRDIEHADANRQAFLRAGAARVVLTVRKGWEEAWVQFAEQWSTGQKPGDDHPYMTIAREIFNYDNRNYPGIPPANPSRTATRLEDSVYTRATAAAAASPNRTTIKVESSNGFVVGLPVLVDSDELQESQVVVEIPNPTSIVVAKLDKSHSSTPFPVVQPGEKGTLIAEWNEYTPNSGTDIAVTSNLSTVA